jgi:F420-0:gamma-glutamyl ligase
MQVTPITLEVRKAPKDSLMEALRSSSLTLKDGDILCVSSKVVSIDEGATVPLVHSQRDRLIEDESDWYYRAPKTSRWRTLFTISRGVMVGGAGIDESNGNGHYIVYPKDPFKSAKRIRKWCMSEYGLRTLAVIITDSTTTPLRRGAVGFALAWDGIDPLRDYRGTQDLFGRHFVIELANLVDALAASAVFVMGEGKEQTPIAVIEGAKGVVFKNRSRGRDQLMVPPEDDIFAPLFWNKKWKRGNRSKDARR